MRPMIYFDNSATTPVDPRVLDAMMPYLTNGYGNPSSIHRFGQEAKAALDRARHKAAAAINARHSEIVFTSGGTEANNLGIRGLAEANRHHGTHIVTSAIEHPAVREVCSDLQTRGFEVTTVPVGTDGIVSPDEISKALRDDTILVSVMTANNEIGTLQPVAEIGGLIRRLRESGRRIWFHTDAVQAVGKVEVDVEQIGCDLLSFSGHKINAPKGVGALYVRRGVRLRCQNLGGRQERERRGGTENLASVVALGEACELAARELEDNAARIGNLRRKFENAVFEGIAGTHLNGCAERRIPGVSNISFEGVQGEGLLINLDLRGIAVSTGSACSSGSIEPSPVLLAIGRDDAVARAAVRFSFGRQNTDEELDYLIGILPDAVDSLRRLTGHR